MEDKKYKEIRYMMKKGDCICKVCKQFGLEVSEVLKLNNIENITDIKAGDYIVLLKEEIKDVND